MSKMIINNRSGITDSHALGLVAEVICMGRISGDDDKYCYFTTFSTLCSVYAKNNKNSDTFIVEDLK